MAEESKLEPLPEDWQRGLAVVAHPDDLEFGTASAVARWTSQGKDIAYLLVTRGEAGIDGLAPVEAGPLREAEERRSAAVVGVHTVEFLDYRDGTVEYDLTLRRDIARAVRRYRPEVILSLNFQLTWGGYRLNMADHRHVGLAALDAARDAGNRWTFPGLLDEGLQPWSGARMVCFNGSPSPTHAVDITDFLDRGIVSLQQHREYIKGLGQEPDAVDEFLRRSASEAGKRAGCDLAVTFEVYLI